MEVTHDLHIHTTLSSCCHDNSQTPANIIDFYKNSKVKLVGFADHIWQNPNLRPSSWYLHQGPVRFNELNEELDELQKTTDIKILCGCEADTIGPGKYSITPQFAETLDFVLLSTNHFYMKDLVMQPEHHHAPGLAEHMISMFVSGVESGFATVIPHCFMPMGFWDFYDEAIEWISDNRFFDLFSRAAEQNVAIEITTAFFPPPPNPIRKPWSLETPVRILCIAKEAGCKFTFASDAHSINGLKKLELLKHLVDVLGLTEDHIHPIARLS